MSSFAQSWWNKQGSHPSLPLLPVSVNLPSSGWCSYSKHSAVCALQTSDSIIKSNLREFDTYWQNFFATAYQCFSAYIYMLECECVYFNVCFAEFSLCFSFWFTCQLQKRISNLSCSFLIFTFAAFSLFSFSLVSCFFLCLPVCLSSLSQRERRDCAAVWLAAVSGACLSWPTYRWRPRICGRFLVNPSSWLRNWAMASLEKSGWVGLVGLCCRGGRWQREQTWIKKY